MAKTTQNYSANAASNTALIAPDGTQIPLGEGQTLPKHVNDAFRALMADTAIAAKFSGLPAGRSVAVTVKLVSNTDSLGSFPAVGGQKLELDGAVNPALVLAGTSAAPHTYTFDTSDSSMTAALRFYEDASQTTEYTTGVTVSGGQTTIAVTDTAPKVLYYQLAGSAGLGGIAYVLGVTGEQQTAAEIKTAYESNADTNAFTDAEKTKLTGIETGATADQTGAEIKTLYEAEANAFTDAQFTKLAGIETGATADQTGAEIKALYEAEANAFTDAQFTKLAGIETGATADQTGAEIKTALFAEADTNNLTDTLLTKLNGIEANADVTDTANVTAAGALMDSEVTNLAQVKAFNSADYATAAQGALADTAVQPNDSPTFGNITAGGLTVSGTSYIQSTTQPQLEIAYNSGNITGFYRSGGDFQIKNDNGAGTPETSILLGEDGAVTLYYDDAAKIATTSTGVDVTGTVTADTFSFANWTVTESGGSLYFATGGTNKMKLDASGNLQVVGSVESNATIS